jgi:hypothetical protein
VAYLEGILVSEAIGNLNTSYEVLESLRVALNKHLGRPTHTRLGWK